MKGWRTIQYHSKQIRNRLSFYSFDLDLGLTAARHLLIKLNDLCFLSYIAFRSFLPVHYIYRMASHDLHPIPHPNFKSLKKNKHSRQLPSEILQSPSP